MIRNTFANPETGFEEQEGFVQVQRRRIQVFSNSLNPKITAAMAQGLHGSKGSILLDQRVSVVM